MWVDFQFTMAVLSVQCIMVKLHEFCMCIFLIVISLAMPGGKRKPLLCLTPASLFDHLSESPASESRQAAGGFSLGTCVAARVAGRDPRSSEPGSKTGPPHSKVTSLHHGIQTCAYLELRQGL